MIETGLSIYMIVINLVTFALYGIDKKRARRSQWRISEKTLLLTALAGGSLGALVGMLSFHHKTKHNAFRFGVPAML